MKSFSCRQIIIPFLFLALTILISCGPVAKDKLNLQSFIPSPSDSRPRRLTQTSVPSARLMAVLPLQSTRTPTPTGSSTGTETASPTDTPTPTPTPTASPTPSETEQPTETLRPTASPTVTKTAQPTATPEPTATSCPVPTQELLWVNPVTSPTNELSQVITVDIGNGEEVTVVSESGTLTVTGDFNISPALVEIPLLPNTVHHLEVIAKVRKVTNYDGCIYGGYTMSTTTDGHGDPLTIVQDTPISYP